MSPELQDGASINGEVIQNLVDDLRRNYANNVQKDVWSSLELRKEIDINIDEIPPTIKHIIFGNHIYNESERQEILSRCAKIICQKLQQHFE